MVLSRLANLTTRKRTRPPIIAIGGSGEADGLWQPIPTAQAATLGLAPAPRSRGEWQVGGQTPRRQTNLSDLIAKYQHFIARERKQPHATFEVTA